MASRKPKTTKTERIKVKTPHYELLRCYSDLWASGANNETILTKLVELNGDGKYTTEKIDKNYLKRYMPAFHEYCRQGLALLTQTRLTSEGLPAQVAMTQARRDKLVELVGNGAAINKAADMLGIPLLTITEQWYKEDATLKQELETARDAHDFEVLEATRKRAVGYTYNSTETVEENVEENGVPIKNEGGEGVAFGGRSSTRSRTVTRTIHVPGSASSQKLWLINRLGWSDTPRGASTDDHEVEYDVRERLYDEEE